MGPVLQESAAAVIKAPSDERLYQVIHLENGLSALLIHDPLMFASSAGRSGDDGEESDSAVGSGQDDEELEESERDNDGEDSMDCDDHDCHSNHQHGHFQSHSRRSLSVDEEEAADIEGPDEEESDGEGAPTKKSSGMVPTKKAAAAMSVGVGSFSDPEDAQGLAHFLEHMLFMGSSKFSDENEYDDFLAKHGGSSNAFTDTEHTCYHFDVNRMYLKPALDRFSQFFISPLAKAEAMDREVLAIDSEFHQVLQSDSCRLLQLQCHTANPKHPFHTFSWGNKESLTLPMAKGVDMRAKMLELYNKYYVAGRMKLTVLGGEPLETLKDWVVELFGEVKSGNVGRLSFPWTGPIWEKGRLYRVESVKDQHRLSLLWPFPCLENAYLRKPQDYISHLIGHEGEGSLLSLLKNKGWATNLSAGVGDGGYERSTAGYMFNVNIDLKESKVLDVIGLFYQYVKMLREIGPQEWVFKELQAMGMMEFKFAEEESADNYGVRLSSNMHLYSEEHIIYGDYAFEEWDAKLVNDLLALINPSNMRVDFVSVLFDRDSPDVQIEPWFDVRYTVEVLPEDLLKTWEDPPCVDSALHMPEVNEFIPHDFSIRARKPGGDIPDVPRILLDDASVKVWYKLDKTFNTPRANTYFCITSRVAPESLKTHVLTEVYVKLLEDALNETLYLANVAKLESSMAVTGDKLELRLFGFNEKLPILALKIATLYQTFVPSADRFQVVKEDLERVYRNTNMKPLKHSAYLRLQVLKERFWQVDDKLACVLSLSLQDVIDFIPQLFEQTYMEVLCHGNLSEEEALNIVSIFKDALISKQLPPELQVKELVYKLPICSHVLDAAVKNKSEDNSVVEMYFQIEQDLGQQSLRSRALLDLFEEIVYEPCFNQLRTKEQLGYRVDCGARVTHRILGFCFRVQSSKFTPPFLQNRMNVFIGALEQILTDLSDEEFASYKEALIAEKMEMDHSLLDETDSHWEQILDQRYLFEARKLEAMEVQTLEKKDVISWYRKFLRADAPSRRKLSIHVWGCKTPLVGKDVELEATEQVIEISDSESFKKWSRIVPESVLTLRGKDVKNGKCFESFIFTNLSRILSKGRYVFSKEV